MVLYSMAKCGDDEENEQEEQDQTVPGTPGNLPRRPGQNLIRTIPAIRFSDSQLYRKLAATAPGAPDRGKDPEVVGIDAANSSVVKINAENTEPEICSICLGEFESNEMVKELLCGHCYHSDCLDGSDFSILCLRYSHFSLNNCICFLFDNAYFCFGEC